MITFPAGCEIVVMHETVSFGRGIDGMCAICRIMLQREPMSSAYFLFRNRAQTQVRVLWYDGQGFSLCTKRLSAGRFPVWPTTHEPFSLVACRALGGRGSLTRYADDRVPRTRRLLPESEGVEVML